jgi:hypothetical protein
MAPQYIGQRKKGHALVMRHIGTNHSANLTASKTRWGIVYCFVKTKLAFKIFPGKSFQVEARFFRFYHQSQSGSIGGDDQILRQAAFETKTGHAEGTVLIIKVTVKGVVSRFRNAPGN